MAADTETPVTPQVGVKPAQEAIQGEGGRAPQATPTSGTSEQPAKGGLPQFRFEYWGGQIVWLLIVFAILYVLLAKVFVPRLRRVQDTRAQTIADAVEQARRVQAEADAQAAAVKAEIAEARSQARRLAAEAKAKAQAEMAQRQAAEDERIAAELDKAELRIRGLRDQAMANVGSIAADTAEAIVAKLTGAPARRAEVEAALAGRSPAKTSQGGVA
jgi:F-type H+-transporting ATPase subunit b